MMNKRLKIIVSSWLETQLINKRKYKYWIWAKLKAGYQNRFGYKTCN